jgi:hypothetical protein
MFTTDLSMKKINDLVKKQNQNNYQLSFVCEKDKEGKLACRWIKGCLI